MANIQELIRKILENFLESGRDTETTVKPQGNPDIDLRSLLIEAHKANAEANRTIAEQARTITALTQGQIPNGDGQSKRNSA
jgi:hypothetical protein